jgi:hypothetical protein
MNPIIASGGNDPFHSLRIVQAFGCIRLRVPAIWSDFPDEDGVLWCCCAERVEREQHTGCLWIGYSVFGPAMARGRRPQGR